MNLIHVSFDRVDEFIPRVPKDRADGEDSTIPRICVTNDIVRAICALPNGGLVLHKMSLLKLPTIIHVYYLKADKVMSCEEVSKYVPDALSSGEMWILEKPKSVYRVDYEITDMLQTKINNSKGREIYATWSIEKKRCKYQSNIDNFCKVFGEEFRELFEKISYRRIITNLDSKLIERFRELNEREVYK